MKRIWIYIVLLIGCLAGGCSKNEAELEFVLPQNVNATYLLLYYASDSKQGMLREDVTVVQNGKGKQVVPCVNPTLVYLFEGSRRLPIVVYARKGDNIRIEGKSTDVLGWSVSGNKINEALTSFRLKNQKAFERNNPEEINGAVAEFVKSNPESGASTLALLLYYDRSLDRAGFEKCWNMLKGDALEGVWRELTGRSDMLNGYEPLVGEVKNPVFKTSNNGMDTIHTDSSPAIFYFSTFSAETRRDDILMLRYLLKERKDSASRLVVDISLEPDSMSWHYRLPQDSLRGAVRAWMPMSYSDSLANVFGLDSQPWFVVTEKGGKIVYAGSEASKASEAFKSIKTANNNQQ